MSKRSKELAPAKSQAVIEKYDEVLAEVSDLLTAARHAASRSVNAIITATYWEVGRRIVHYEQEGHKRANYGELLLERLAQDLTNKFGRGFGRENLRLMRQFYLIFQDRPISQTVSGKFKATSNSALKEHFPLPWSHYVRLLSVKDRHARAFYETETLRGGWTIRQLHRQIGSQFYERTALSRNKAAMLTKGARRKSEDKITPDEEIKDPLVLEFLNLKDEYSESELEEALILHLESFLLELGGHFTFVGRQKRLRIGNQWFRVDLVFFHRRLRCLIIFELKLKEFTHADVGQMNLYINYAQEHWAQPGENAPVGLILCASKDPSVERYALKGISNKVLASEYKTILPEIETISFELERTRKLLEERSEINPKKKS